MADTRKVAFYIRVSTEMQAREGFSLEGQQDEA
jgi:DNA invertase Pin-like site-specific DNA recombinase